MSLLPQESHEERVRRWMNHNGTPPLFPDPDYDEAQRRKLGANPLQGILKQLMGGAGPRGATFAGRVIPQGQTPNLKELLTQTPQESPDAEGMGGIATLAAGGLPAARTLGTKVFREAADTAPVARGIGGKTFRELSAGDLVKQSYDQLMGKKLGGERLNLMSVPSNRGGRAGLILPDGQVVFGSSHGDLIKQYGPRFGRNQKAIQGNLVMDVDTSAGRHLLSVGQLEDLYAR